MRRSPRTLAEVAFGRRRVRGTVYVTRAVVSLLWEPRDLWVGVYWDTGPHGPTVYVCVLPCLPIRVSLCRRWWTR